VPTIVSKKDHRAARRHFGNGDSEMSKLKKGKKNRNREKKIHTKCPRGKVREGERGPKD